MNEFDSSDEETETFGNPEPFHLDWLNLQTVVGAPQVLGIGCLPGCRFKDASRNLNEDLDAVCLQGVQDVFVLCTSVELRRYRVDGLLDGYKARGVVTHHHPVHEGMAPDIASCLALLDELRGCLEDGKCMVIHCFEGLGRSCLIAACLLLSLSDTLTADQAIEALCSVRGSRAIQTIKQYNFVHEFRTLSEAHQEAKFLATTARSVSR